MTTRYCLLAVPVLLLLLAAETAAAPAKAWQPCGVSQPAIQWCVETDWDGNIGSTIVAGQHVMKLKHAWACACCCRLRHCRLQSHITTENATCAISSLLTRQPLMLSCYRDFEYSLSLYAVDATAAPRDTVVFSAAALLGAVCQMFTGNTKTAVALALQGAQTKLILTVQLAQYARAWAAAHGLAYRRQLITFLQAMASSC
jgi:hypothetical protein